MIEFDDICRCGVICVCGGDDWGEEPADVWCCTTCERIARAAGDATLSATLSAALAGHTEETTNEAR